ncbi:MAG TPA: o-succinylbenzoate--CoA ligase, partial [Anaerolineae bacterium]
LAWLDAVLVPLSTRLAVPELARQLAFVGCRWLLYTAETAETATELASNDFTIIEIGDWTLRLRSGQGLEINESPIPKLQSPVSDLQAIVFTSGTTGRPKGVELTFSQHFSSAMSSAYRLGLEVDDLWLSCLPLYHVGGLAVIWRSCLYGTAVDLHPRFDLDAINHSLDTRPVTLISLVPTMLYRLLQSRTGWPECLRLILLGGAAAAPEMIEQTNQMAGRPIVAPTYGLTEAASQVATMLPRDAARKPGSVGRPLLFTSVRIVGEDGRELAAGEYGEVVVSGPVVMRGYYNNPEATAEVLKDNALYTGDIGYVDEDGDLWLVQRRSDIIVSGGENVYPAEVEQALKQHPAVASVGVVGVPHSEWGQQVAAAVVLREDQVLTEAELVRFGRERLAGYKLPRLVRFVDSLPQTASGKIARQAIVDMLQREN